MDPLEKDHGYLQEAFKFPGSTSSLPTVTGVCQSHHHITRVPATEAANIALIPVTTEEDLIERTEEGKIYSPHDSRPSFWSPFACRKDSISTDRIYWDQVHQSDHP